MLLPHAGLWQLNRIPCFSKVIPFVLYAYPLYSHCNHLTGLFYAQMPDAVNKMIRH